MAAARKTDKIACALLSRGLLGEDALKAAASTITGERDPGLKTGCALCTALNPAPSSSRTWLLLCCFFIFFFYFMETQPGKSICIGVPSFWIFSLCEFKDALVLLPGLVLLRQGL